MIELPTESEPVRVVEGDCLDVLRSLPAGCVDAVVTDPPYGLEFMGREWDSFRGDAWRVGAGFSKPGIGDRKTPWPSFGAGDSANATCDACGGRMRGANKCDCDDPDWRVKGKPLEHRNGRAEQGRAFGEWCGTWLPGVLSVLKPGGYLLAMGGTRTYHRLACAVEDSGFEVRDCLSWLYGSGFPKGKGCLKPAWEPVLLCRKPGPRVLPLGVDECRVPFASAADESEAKDKNRHGYFGSGPMTDQVFGEFKRDRENYDPPGRWPANVAHDGSDEVMEAFATFGENKGAEGKVTVRNADKFRNSYGDFKGSEEDAPFYGDTGTAARFYYTAKASRRERGDGNTHPTVKPLALMRWLVKLVCPAGGLVLDPFAGSGTTAVAAMTESRRCLLIEREPAYAAIARKRVDEALAKHGLFAAVS